MIIKTINALIRVNNKGGELIAHVPQMVPTLNKFQWYATFQNCLKNLSKIKYIILV